MPEFIQVATIALSAAVSNPMDMWAGFDGAGFDGKLFLTCGGRLSPGAHGGAIFSHDDLLGDTNWVKEFEDDGLETIAKIRDWTDASGTRRLYAWAETPASGQSTVLRRSIGSSVWSFESVPFSPSATGGRGLGSNFWGSSDLFEGHTDRFDDPPNAEAVVRRKDRSTGTWSVHRTIARTQMRELEFEPSGALWEFYNDNNTGFSAYTYRAGQQLPNPPGGGGDGIRSASFFPRTGHMYVACRGTSNAFRRFRNGAWELVLSASGKADHVKFVPRGAGELWAVGMDPLEVWMSVDGVNWVRQTSIPSYMQSSGSETNNLTAIGFYRGRVWLAARDQSAGLIRVYRENIAPSGGTAQMSQVI